MVWEAGERSAPGELLDWVCKLWRLARRTGPGLDVVLIGTDDAWLAAAPHLRGLLQQWTTVRALTIEEVVHFIPHVHEIYADVDPKQLVRVDDSYAHGRWDAWAKFTAAVRRGQTDDERTLGPADVDRALDQLRSGARNAR